MPTHTSMKYFIILLIGAISHSCSDSKHSITSIPINIGQASDIAIRKDRLIQLETSDSTMLYDINTLETVSNKLIVHSRNYLRSFNKHTGNFTGDIAHEGKNESNFSYIGNLWTKGDTIYLFDTNTGYMQSYSPDGKYYGRKQPFGRCRDGERPRQYLELPGIGIFTTNLSTDNTTPSNPRYSFYTYGNKQGRPVPGREIIEPTYLSDGTLVDSANHRLLSWEPLRDTIFEVTKESVKPLYHVDFGSMALPEKVQGMKYSADRIEWFNNGKEYLSLLRYVQLHKDKIYFSFACSNGNNYLACYDKTTNQTSLRHITTEDGTFSQSTFFKITGDSALVEIRNRIDLFANPLLYQIPLADLY